MVKINLFLGQQKQSFDRHGIGNDEKIEVILLKPNTLGNRYVSSSNKNPTPCVFCM